MKNKMLKIILFCLILAMALFFAVKGFIKPPSSLYNNLTVDSVKVSGRFIYGTHLNYTFTLPIDQYDISECNIVFLTNLDTDINTEEMLKMPLYIAGVDENNNYIIKTSEYINSGIDLENIDSEEYALILEVVYILQGEKTKEKLFYTYYPIQSDENTNELVYYSLTQNGKNKKITIAVDEFFINDINVACLKISAEETELPQDVYDIVLEVGHGGSDPGACGYLNGKLYKESDFNLKMAIYIKQLLTEQGYKVALTRYDNTDTPSYGLYGRGTLCNTLKAKYNFSIHNNSHKKTGYTGSEVYVAANTDITLASALADSISAKGYGYSTMPNYRIADGVYCRLNSQADVDDEINIARKQGYTPYEKLTVGSNYYFMVREIGGLSTGAYVDGRNVKYDANPYYLSDNTAEGLIFEFAYLNTSENLSDLIVNYKEYCVGFVEGFTEYINRNDSTNIE